MKPYANGPQISEATEYVREGNTVNHRNLGTPATQDRLLGMAKPFGEKPDTYRRPSATAPRGASIANLSASLPKLSPKHVDRLSDGRGALQCRFLENASRSLLVLFGPQAVQSQE